MAVAKTFAPQLDPTADGLALTFIVPTQRCDLRCAFCIVAQRREAGPWRLRPEDYARFIEDIAGFVPVRVCGLQGYEPLLEDSWPYTHAIIETSNSLGVPTSLVTNGSRLEERTDELDAMGLKDLTVSLDAADPEIHDRQRGVPGAFKRTLAGIRAALAKPLLRDRLVVAAVLLPNRRKQLDTMPRLLVDLGVRYFGVTPLIRVGRDRLGGMVQNSHELIRDLDLLQESCTRAGITFVVDDELQQFRHLVDGANRFMIHSLARPGRLLRLTPSGACSVGVKVLQAIGEDTPVWQPERESPRDFLERLEITPAIYPLRKRDAPVCAGV
jgi:MoaA/NifB/PqqE/SkfB family radical SAM enzyme